MCGIYVTNLPIESETARGRLESIKYRGPDFTGILKEDNLLFGHLRLSIIDLDNRSNQPMCHNNLIIVFNGEIYNYQIVREELINLGYQFITNGDTEVILKGFHCWGEEVVHRLNGMWAFVIYDKDTKQIFGSRDRLGVKPFYYYWHEGVLEICSQIKPISNDKEINDSAISIYLDSTYIPSPHTIFKRILKLPPGNNILINLKTNEGLVKEYWNLSTVETRKVPYKQAKNELHELLKDAVRIRLNSDVPFGTFLSGGIDSALVTSIASKISKKQIRTFSIGFEDPRFDESKIAANYASILNTLHTETICKPNDILELLPKLIQVYDEPFADSSALPSLLLNKTTKSHVTMALSGDGGDESFLGYNYFDWLRYFQKINKIPFIIRKLLSKSFIGKIGGSRKDILREILNTKNESEFITKLFIGFKTILKHRDLQWMESYSGFKVWSKNSFQSAADLNIKLWLENDSNVKVDRASMAYSIEVRSPFLDYRVVEFARSLPVSFRIAKGRKKRIIRDILSEYIPEEVFDQPKKGFAIPLGYWIRNELKLEIERTLTLEFLEKVPNLNKEKFNDMWHDHMAEKSDNSSYIWRLYILAKWYEEFGFKTK